MSSAVQSWTNHTYDPVLFFFHWAWVIYEQMTLHLVNQICFTGQGQFDSWTDDSYE